MKILTKLGIEGMTCHSCVNSIEQKIGEVNGVIKIEVSLEHKNAEIEYDSDLISNKEIAEKIEDMGFEVKFNQPNMIRTSVAIKGMTCNTCVRKIESNLLSYDAVQSIKVYFDDRRAKVVLDSNKMLLTELCSTISQLGFIAEQIKPQLRSESSVKISVKGMTCNSCVKSIEDFVSQKPGVQRITVSLKEELASIIYDSSHITSNELRDIIDDMGFEASIVEVVESNNEPRLLTLSVETLSSTNWSTEDENQLFELNGVLSVASTFEPVVLNIMYVSNVISVNDIMNNIQSIGFICKEITEKSVDRSDSLSDSPSKIILNGIDENSKLGEFFDF